MAANEFEYRYYNAHGDLAVTVTDDVVRAGRFDPFGNIVSTSVDQNWVGRWDKQSDGFSGYVDMGARPYDPSLGRFLGRDPVEGGSLNPYEYAGQDPVNGYDLDGQRCWWGRSCWRGKFRTLARWGVNWAFSQLKLSTWVGRIAAGAVGAALFTAMKYAVGAALCAGTMGIGCAVAIAASMVVGYYAGRYASRWVRRRIGGWEDNLTGRMKRYMRLDRF